MMVVTCSVFFSMKVQEFLFHLPFFKKQYLKVFLVPCMVKAAAGH